MPDDVKAARMTEKERRRWREINGIAQTGEDKAFCRDLERRGFAVCYGTRSGNWYFHLTTKGEREVYR